MKNTLILSAALAIVCVIASAILAVGDKYTKPGREKAMLAEKSAALKQVLPEHDNQPLQDSVTVAINGTKNVTFYRARRNGEVVAVAGLGVTDKGFSGRLEMLTGLTPAGDIIRVVVTAHTETPGLGSVVTDRAESRTLGDLFNGNKGEEKKPGNTVPPSIYLDQYNSYNVMHQPASRIVHEDSDSEVDAVSGATSHYEKNVADGPAFRVDKDGGEIQGVSGATITSRAVADAVSNVAQAFMQHREEIINSQGNHQ